MKKVNLNINFYRYRHYYQEIEPILKNPKTQAYAMIILSLFTISFFGFFAIRPTLKTIAALQRKISDHTQVNNQLEDKINALIKAQEEYQNIESLIPTIYSLMPQTPEFTSLIRQLEILASQHNIVLSELHVDPLVLYGNQPNTPDVTPQITQDENILAAETTTPTFPVIFSVSFTGNYQDLVTLLDRLTNFDRIVTISLVDINVANESTLTINVQSRAYYFPLDL